MTLKQAALRIQKELSEHGFHMSAHAGKIAAALGFIEDLHCEGRPGVHGRPSCGACLKPWPCPTFKAARDGVPE